MSFSATDCPLDDTCMDIHISRPSIERDGEGGKCKGGDGGGGGDRDGEGSGDGGGGSGCGGRDGEYSGRGGGDSEGSGMGEKGVAGTTCCDSGCG